MIEAGATDDREGGGKSPLVEREYEYRLKEGRLLVKAILYGIGFLWLAGMALTNDRALLLFNFPLSENTATLVYAAGAALAAIFCVHDGAHVALRGKLRQRIAFTADGLLVPVSDWSREERLIRFGDVVKWQEITTPDTLFLIEHRRGAFTIRLDLLPDERAYAEVIRDLTSRVQSAQAKSAD